ncbi:hypothetical protein [Pedobacter insulae]|uniref:PEP-CTERM protein-sorting domain-containing protein n=1 Tax=Pedobacter insulae TaxID=414048 RepID=A0A1I2VV05_9SPHI|nr:hypothetical protein [Pedobacter insulae]SFG92933.1 hypothetical protein SAMN04489864_103280 [Pedobacter insulae]
MKRSKVIWVLFLLLIFSQPVFATVGCLVGNKLHTRTNAGSSGGIPSYDDSPNINATGFCIRNGTSSTPCQVRVWFFVWFTTANGFQGDYGIGAPIYCPIDTYINWMLIPIGLVGMFFIRKRYVRLLSLG